RASARRGTSSRRLWAVALPQRRHREGQPRLDSLELLGPRLPPAQGRGAGLQFWSGANSGGGQKKLSDTRVVTHVSFVVDVNVNLELELEGLRLTCPPTRLFFN